MTELPDGWGTRVLGDIADIVRGVTYKKSDAKTEPGPGYSPLLRATNIGPSLDLESELVYVPTAGINARQFLRSGDIVLASSSGSLSVVGKNARLLADWDGTFGAFCAVIRSRPEVDSRYLALYLSSHQVRRRWSEAARGTNINNLKKSDLAPTPVPVPPMDEQRRIVDILEDHLSRLDAAGKLLAAADHRSELLRAVTLESLAPKGTPLRTLGELATDSGYGTSTKCVVDGPGVPVVRIPNLSGGRVDLADEKRVAEAALDLTRLMLAQDDLLIVRTNGSRDLIGRAAVVQPGVSASFASYLIRFRLDPSQVRPQWVRVMLGTPSVRRVLEALAASSAGQYNLGLKKLNGVTIPCPSIEDQDRLLARFDEHEWALASLTRSLADGESKAQSLRRSLLSAAFSGRLTGRSSDLDTAEELSVSAV